MPRSDLLQFLGRRIAPVAAHELEFYLIDPARNEQGSGDRLLSADDSLVTVLALATNEELVVARRAFRRLTAA